jgi:RNA polymerase sigma-70 factor (ECF subfamily)
MSETFPSQVDETKLVLRCLQGDKVAVREFISHFQQMIFTICYRMTNHRQDAEDITQDTLIRILKNLHRWDSTRSLRPWIVTITMNRCRTHLTSKQSKNSQLACEHLLEGRGDAVQKEIREELELALKSLKPEYRTCFTMFYQQECSCQEIADIMKCPVGTVKTWLHRARQVLIEQLSRRQVFPEIRS